MLVSNYSSGIRAKAPESADSFVVPLFSAETAAGSRSACAAKGEKLKAGDK